MTLQRMWINQPSTLQALHNLHGLRVLAVHESETISQVYFLAGGTISQQVPRQALSEGWPARKNSEPDLFYLTATNDNGDDMTLLVVARSKDQALSTWREHWWGSGEPDAFTGQLVDGRPQKKAADNLLIYQVDYDPGMIGALSWGREMDMVGYVPP